MSRTIDNRVVEMQFDNKQFEQGIAESRQSLKELDKDLKFESAAQGLTNLNQAFDKLDLTNIENGVMALQDRFSTFGIFTMQIIERLSNSLINFATNSLGKVFNQIVTGGTNRAMNIENARFSLQGLLKDSEKVQSVMDVAMDSVDGTAYGFDQAAKAASMFVTTGMTMTASELVGPLKAVAGVAAQTNSDYSRMADIFTTVAGNGRLMGQQLTQFSYYGLNAAQTIADYLNKNAALRKQLKITHQATEADIRDLVSKGKISFKIFSAAMEEAFGEHAKDANKTFNGAMSNIKAALSRIGADFIQPLIEQEGPMVRMFNSLRIAVNAIRKELKPFADIFVSIVTKIASSIESISNINPDMEKTYLRFYILFNGLKNIYDVLVYIFGEINKYIPKMESNVSPLVDTLNLLFTKFWYVTYSIKNFIIQNKNIPKIIKGITDTIKLAVSIFSSIFSVFKTTISGLSPLIDQFLEIFGNFGESAGEVSSWITASNILEKAVNKINSVLEPLISLITSIYPIIKNTFKSGGGGAGGIINSFFGIITRGITSVMHSIEEILGIDLTLQIGWIINKLKDLKNIVMETSPFFNEFINFFKDFGKIIYNSFKSSEGGLEGFVTSIFNVLTRATTTLMHAFEDLTGIDLTKYIGNVIVFFRKAKETVIGARDSIQGLKDKIQEKWESREFEGIRNLFENVKETFINVKNVIVNAINETTDKFDSLGVDFSKIGTFLGGVYKVILTIGNVIGTVISAIWSAISPFLTDLTSALTEGDIQKVSDIFVGLLSILAGFKGFQVYESEVEWLINLFTKDLPNMFTTLTNSMNNTAKMPTTISRWLNAQIDNIKYKQVEAVATSILMIAGAAYLLSKIPAEGMTRSMLAIEALVGSVAGIMYELSMLSAPGAGLTGPIIALGVAILLLASSLEILSKIEPDRLENGFNAIIGLMAGITGAIAAMTAVSGDLKRVSGTMIALGIAIILLSVSLKMLAKLDPDALERGFLAITGLISDITISLTALMAVSSTGGNLKKAAGSMVAIGIAVLIMAASLKMLAKLDPNTLQLSFSIMSLALLEMVAALTVLGLLSKGRANIGKAAASLVIASVAIAILGAALAKLTNDINPDNAAAALVVLGLALAELAIALTFMQDSVAGSGALLIASVAIVVLAAALKSIADLNPEQLMIGIIGMAAAFGILVAATVGLSLIPGGAAVLLAIAGAILMVGLAFLSMGSGITLIGTGLLLINAALIAFAATSVVTLTTALNKFTIFLQGLRVIIPLISAVITDLIVAIIRNLGLQLGVIIDTLKVLAIKIFDMLIELLPKLEEFLVLLVNVVFNVLDETVPRLIQFLEILLENVLIFLEYAIPRLIEFVLNLLMSIWDLLGEKIPELADHAATMIINAINGLAEVIREREPELKEAINNLLQAVLDAMLDILGLAPGSEPVGDQIFMDFIAKMCLGIETKKAELWYKISEAIRLAVQKVTDKFREAFDIGKNFIQGLINGIGSKINDLLETVGNAGADVIESLVNIFQTHSPSRVTERIGENLDEGLINGVKKLTGAMVKTAETSGIKVLDKFSEIVDGIYDILDEDMDFSPVISPILDSSSLEDGMDNVNGMFSNYGLNLGGSYKIAGDIDSESISDEEIQNGTPPQTIVNFTQNNNSPKALSRIDIYRDTKNMLNNPALSTLFNK